MQVCLDQMAPRESVAREENKELEDHKERLDHKVHLDKLVPMAIQEQLVPQVYQDLLEHLETQ